MKLIIKQLLREALDKTITCTKCGWHWKESESSKKDLYICHECGHDNATKKESLNERLLTKKEGDIRDIADFVNFAKDYLGITDDIKIELAYERTPDLKTYAYYRIGDLIKVYVKDRNSGDIFRSLCHELVHHLQHLEGRLTDPEKDGADGSDLENEANSKAGEILRKWGKLHSEIYQ
jgi:DNA-directed RNA polymerase subunit RPC12/RpoP